MQTGWSDFAQGARIVMLFYDKINAFECFERATPCEVMQPCIVNSDLMRWDIHKH